MPERYPTKNPQVIAGTILFSGAPNTGQVQNTYGGSHTYQKLSGVVGPDQNIWVGGGRLDGIYVHPSADAALSGKAILFYDSAVAVSGGPLGTSGHKIIGGVQFPPLPGFPNAGAGASGVPNAGGYVQIPGGFPFWSGLCHTTASGQFGFTASYTPVVSA